MFDTGRIGTLMTIAAWAGLLLLLTWAASMYLEQQYNPNSSPDSSNTVDGAIQVLLERNRSGHYVVTGAINRQPVRFLVDTGATYVAVDQTLARQLELRPGAAQYLQTANGSVKGYRTVLKEVSVGGITITTVPAVIMPDLGDNVLLGMSFLKRLTLVQKGNTLMLEQE